MSAPLLPCPFCGGNDVQPDDDRGGLYCSSCLAEGPPLRGGAELSGPFADAIEDGADAAALWNRRASGWISVEERLPETNVRDDSTLGYLTHWMPLPEPPRVSRKEPTPVPAGAVKPPPPPIPPPPDGLRYNPNTMMVEYWRGGVRTSQVAVEVLWRAWEELGDVPLGLRSALAVAQEALPGLFR